MGDFITQRSVRQADNIEQPIRGTAGFLKLPPEYRICRNTVKNFKARAAFRAEFEKFFRTMASAGNKIKMIGPKLRSRP